MTLTEAQQITDTHITELEQFLNVFDVQQLTFSSMAWINSKVLELINLLKKLN